MHVSVVVEGFSDEGVVEAMLSSSGIAIGGFFGRGGRSQVLKKLHSYNQAAARKKWLPQPAERMCFRIAVREVEAWLLADAEEVAEFLAVPLVRIPAEPETLPDPKATLIALAGRSRKKAVREGLVPRTGSGAAVSPTYASDVREFARSRWRPQVAAESAPSLARCLARLEGLRSERW